MFAGLGIIGYLRAGFPQKEKQAEENRFPPPN